MEKKWYKGQSVRKCTNLTKLLYNQCKNKQQQLKSSVKYLNPKVLTKHLNQKVLTEHLLRQNTSQGHKSAILSCLESNDLQWPQEHKLVFSKVIGHFETLLWNKSFDLNTQNNDLSTPNKCN